MRDLTPSREESLRERELIDAAANEVFGSTVADAKLSSGTTARPIDASIPTIPGYLMIGPLTRGGQAAVYHALHEATGREVAIKVLDRPVGGGSTSFERFDREISILARLQHPNIVAVHDSGTTDGQQFFVMDFVAGRPVDRYLSDVNPGVGEIVRVAIKICDAVHAAHLRGVIHRDLKPANILIDDNGEPHILDFGLAKLASGQGRGSTHRAVTVSGQFVGSLPWASPEQVSGDTAGTDLRTDIYSIGIILFHALAGRFPYDVHGPIHKVFSNILEVEPIRMQRLRPGIAADVETIVRKCLAKDPEHRYQSAAAVAEDLRRFLADEPIVARPASTMYQLGKLIRRNKLPTALILALLVVIVAFGAWMAVLYRGAEAARAAEYRQRLLAEAAEQEARSSEESARRIASFLTELFSSAQPDSSKGRDISAREIVDRGAERLRDALSDDPDTRTTLMMTIADVYRSLAMYDSAQSLLQAAVDIRRSTFGEDHEKTSGALVQLAGALRDLGKYSDAESLYQKAIAAQRRALPRNDLQIAQSLNNYSVLLCKQWRFAEAEPLDREALKIRKERLGLRHADVAQSLNGLGMILFRLGDLDQSEPLLREALGIRRHEFGDVHSTVAATIDNLARLLDKKGQFAESERLFREELAITEKLYGTEHPRVGLCLDNLGISYYGRTRYEDAEPLFRRSLAISRKSLASDHPELASTVGNLAATLSKLDRIEEAEPLFRESIHIREMNNDPHHPSLASPLLGLGTILLQTKKAEEAEPLLRRAAAIRRSAKPSDEWAIAAAESALGECCVLLGRYEEAESILLNSYQQLVRLKGDADPESVRGRHRLFLLYSKWGRPDQAATWKDAAG